MGICEVSGSPLSLLKRLEEKKMSNELRKGVTIGAKKEDASAAVEDRGFSSEETASQMKLHEEDFLQGLVEAAGFAEDEEQLSDIEIVRPDGKTGEKKVLFRFRVKGLTEQEYTRCKRRHTKYVRNRSLGVKMPEDTNGSLYRAALIYEATIPEDRTKLWDNKDAWEALRSKGKQIVRGLDVIETCLKAGEKDKVIDVIDRLSGYDDNIEEVADSLEDTIKN